jgi:hypothetical protein
MAKLNLMIQWRGNRDRGPGDRASFGRVERRFELDRVETRVRDEPLRLLHRTDRRHGGSQLCRARSTVYGETDHHGGRSGRWDGAGAAPKVVSRAWRRTMRLLYPRDAHGDDGAATTKRQSDPGRSEKRAGRQSLPLHGLHANLRSRSHLCAEKIAPPVLPFSPFSIPSSKAVKGLGVVIQYFVGGGCAQPRIDPQPFEGF